MPQPGLAGPATSPIALSDGPVLTRGFLFADLRDYTGYVDTHGDRAGARLLERYRALVRAAVADAHGAEIRTEGDSFYVVFDSVSSAVRCGMAIIDAAAATATGCADPIRVGVGVHAGETVGTPEGFVGSAVNIAARVCSLAGAGEQLVTDLVRGLTRTSLPYGFVPVGTCQLKGIGEPMALYRVVADGAGAARDRSGMPSPCGADGSSDPIPADGLAPGTCAPVGLRMAPLIAAKLHVPSRVTSYRERPRLNEQLDGTLDDATRLTVLSAPPGYGKSVAVAGWLASRATTHAWLSLDATDNDPARFLRYLGAALEPLRPSIATLGPALLESMPGAEAAALLIEAMSASDDPFVLVLDDYQAITAEPVHALVRFLIEHGPPFGHLVLITREDPPFALPRLRAHRRLVEVRAEELRWTADEAAAYLGETSGLELDASRIARLVERTEGWIAGLQLAAISLRSGPSPDALVDAFAGSQRFVLDYLAAEVLGRLDPDLRDFLIRCSVVERFTAGLCRHLTGRDDSAALIERAERMNLFLIPLDLDRCCYRFHHLFADYLRTLLEPADEAALRERAAGYYEAAGMLDDAIDQAVAAGAVDRAIRLLEQHALPTYEAGELSTLLRWLDALPRDRVAASAELISLRAWACFNVGRVGDAARACAEGEAGTAGRAVPGRLLAVRALIAAFSLRPDAVRLAREAIDSLEGDAVFLALTGQALAASLLNAGEFESAGETARMALETLAGAGRSTLVAPPTTALASVLNVTGRRGDAEALCRRMLTDHQAEARRLAGGTPYMLYWLGMVRYEANDLPGALHDLETAWAAAGTFGFGRALLTLAVSFIALARQASGLSDAARDAVRTVRRDARAAGLSGLEGGLDEIEARLRLAQGDVAGAARWADAVQRGDGADPAAAQGWPSLTRTIMVARARIAQGRASEAGALLRRARPVAVASHDVADLITIAALEAQLAELSGDRRKAQAALEEAIRLAAPERYLRRIIDDGRGVFHLLPAVRRIAPAFIDEVSAALGAPMAGRVAPAHAGAIPAQAGRSLWLDADGQPLEALTGRELDVLRLMARGSSDAAIADELVVSLATAKWHAAHIRAKLGAKSRTQALVRAGQLGLV